MIVRLLLLIVTGVAMLVPAPSASGKNIRTETCSFSAEGITGVVFPSLSSVEFVYRGFSGAKAFSVRIVENYPGSASEGPSPRVTARIRGTVMAFRLEIPEGYPRLGRRGNRPITLEITGPTDMDVTVDSERSDIRVQHTSGLLSLAGERGDISVLDHDGGLRIDAKYGVVTGERIRGGFDVDCRAATVTLAVAEPRQNSSVNVAFGKAELNLPRNAGAEFLLHDRSGGITFDTRGSFVLTGHGKRRYLNGGGPRVSLTAKLGQIVVTDAAAPGGALHPENASAGIVPLGEGMWWRYTEDGDTLTLRVAAVRSELGQLIATLAFDEMDSAPFGSIDVYESGEGLFLYGINRGFFGKDVSGILLNPPRLWLPYDPQSPPVHGDDLTGTVRVEASSDSTLTPAGRFGNVVTYRITGADSSIHRIRLVPGRGFVSFDDMALSASGAGQPSAFPGGETPPLKVLPESAVTAAEPEFPEGPVRSIAIIGNHFRSDRELRRKLDLREGQTYTRDEIAAAVERLKDDPLIDYVSFDLSTDGELRVFVYENPPFSVDFGTTASFTRVSGIGTGLSLKVSSREAPVSDADGYLRYDWAAERWAGGITLDRRFFSRNPLVVGVGYRNDFGSNMEWAIPEDDARLNAFLLGRSVENYFRRESSSVFISQSLGSRFTIRAEYFENRYSSVDKETNWSLFDRGDTKRDNPPLSPASEGFVTGTHLSFNLRNVTSIMDFRGRFDLERTYQGHDAAYPAYTRLSGYGSWNMRYWHGHLVKFRVAGGYSPNDLPDQRSFQLGGHNTLRGYDVLSVPGDISPDSSFNGGDRAFLMNVDYFYGENMSLIFFGDLGGVWRKGEAVTASGTNGLKRDVGIGIAFGSDFFSSVEDKHKAGFRINWATPAGPVSHGAHWTVNFVRAY